jgi:hypothetical protein
MTQELYDYALSKDYINGNDGGFKGKGSSMPGWLIKESLAQSIQSVLEGTSEHEESRPYYKSLLEACEDNKAINKITQQHRHYFENQWMFE